MALLVATSTTQLLWRSRFSVQLLHDGNKRIIYFEDFAVASIGLGLIGFVAATSVSWLINLPILPRPPATEYVNQSYLTHLGYWSKSFINNISPTRFEHEAWVYYRYLETLQHYQLDYTIATRFWFGLLAGAIGFIKGLKLVWQNPIQQQIEVHMQGLQVHEFKVAETKLLAHFKNELKKYGAFTRISDNVDLSMKRVFSHHLIFGASGTGKSQYMASAIKSAIDKKLKVVVLDPKYEFTKAYYKKDGTCAILDPTDARSHVWDIARDLYSIGLIKKLAAAIIPSKGNDPMWSNAARAIFVGMIVYLRANFKDVKGVPNYNWQDIADILVSSPEELIHIMQNYYPEALKLVGELNVETNQVQSNATTAGIMINLLSFMGGLRDLARFWYVDADKPQKKISLYRFMTDSHYKIKTIFIKPNDTEGEMSTGIIRAILVYSISLLDSPKIPDSNTPRGMFFLDEFQAPGKLETETGQPVIDKLVDRGRSKQFGCYLASQAVLQLYKVYTKEDVDSWRETTSNFILTGAPLGETANKVCEFLGEQFVDKLHVSMSYGNGGAPSANRNYQEHSKKAMLPSQLTSKLEISDTHIRYLALFRGIPDAYILEKPFVNIPEIHPIWVERPQLETTVNLNSRVKSLLTTQMAGGQTIANETTAPEVAKNLVEEFDEESGEIGMWVDTGQHMDEMSKEEREFTEEDEDVAGEVIKGMVTEPMIDSHGISTILDLLVKITEKTNNPQSNKTLQKYMVSAKRQI